MPENYDSCIKFGKNENRYVDSIRRANIAGFVKIAVTMLAEGVV